MKQLIYISSIRRGAAVDPAPILSVSQRNNARDRVTGLLFFDGRRFLQALEGDAAAVDAAFARIRDDPRHHAIVILSDRTIAERAFGEWAMAWRAPGEGGGDPALDLIGHMTADCAPSVRATFESFAQVRRAA